MKAKDSLRTSLGNTDFLNTLSITDTFGTGTKCSPNRVLRLIESQIKGVKKDRDQL